MNKPEGKKNTIRCYLVTCINNTSSGPRPLLASDKDTHANMQQTPKPRMEKRDKNLTLFISKKQRT